MTLVAVPDPEGDFGQGGVGLCKILPRAIDSQPAHEIAGRAVVVLPKGAAEMSRMDVHRAGDGLDGEVRRVLLVEQVSHLP